MGAAYRIDNMPSPRAAIVCKPVSAIPIYSSYSVSHLPLITITAQVKPEQFTNYEVGPKWDVSRNLSFTAAAFRNTRSTDPNDPTRIVQTGSQRTNGFKAGWNGSITRAWQIAGGYAWQDAFFNAGNHNNISPESPRCAGRAGRKLLKRSALYSSQKVPMSRTAMFTFALLPLALLSCGGQHSADERYYLVSANTKVPYWQEAQAGLFRGAAQLQVKAEMLGPDTYDPKAEHEQFQDVLKRKPSGILVSASDPNLLKEDIDAAIAQGIPVIAVDADTPSSKRLLFIGTDNYKAGVMGAQVLAKALQGKGSVVVFTMPEQINIRDRLRGYRDVLADHPQIKISEVIDMKGDPRVVFDKTMELVEKGANVDGFICLTSISGPEVAEVLSRKKTTGKVVVAMDADQRTLDGIQKGLISATVAQKPFTMTFLGIKILDDLHHHPLRSLTANWAQDPFSPLPAIVDTGATLVDKSNVDAFLQARSSATSRK